MLPFDIRYSAVPPGLGKAEEFNAKPQRKSPRRKVSTPPLRLVLSLCAFALFLGKWNREGAKTGRGLAQNHSQK
jgi:hypothetical protein